MLKIRLQRVGRKNDPSFRVVVTESTTAAKKPGTFQEVVGHYDPRKDTHTLNADRIKYWMGMGAQVSGTVHNLLITAGVLSGKKVNVLPKKTPIQKEESTPEPEAVKADEVTEVTDTEEVEAVVSAEEPVA